MLDQYADATPRRDFASLSAVEEPEDLTGANFSNMDLVAADVRDFRGGKLREAKFRGTILLEASFNNADLRESDFRSSYCENADFEEAKLKSAKFGGGNFQGANFRGASLRGVTTSPGNKANVRSCDFRDANLSGADFSNAHSLGDANLQGAIYTKKTVWPEGFDASSYGATLQRGVAGFLANRRG